MAPLPKKKHSRARKGGRAAHHFISAPGTSTCSHCSSVKLPHRACHVCGTYKGREVIESDTGSQDIAGPVETNS
ncbi:MAG: 50S ribosomal protein L32 [Chloroflexi bacterium]|nr:50S ribosomal protein L32 [Chloroflexota bacterium]